MKFINLKVEKYCSRPTLYYIRQHIPKKNRQLLYHNLASGLYHFRPLNDIYRNSAKGLHS